MNVLITSAGRRVSLVRSFINELRKLDFNARVYAADMNPVESSACHVAAGFFKVPRLSHPDYFDELERICLENDIRLVVPTIDTELLSMSRVKQRFLDKGIRLLVADEEFVLKCRDKRQIHEFFMEKGVQVAREYAKDNYQLPLFIKPIDGSRSVDTYVIREESELTDYHFQNEKLMFLEYLDHDRFEEFTCDMYYDRTNRLRCIVPRKRILVRDGEVNKGLTVRNSVIPYLRERMETVKGAVGCLTAQFFVHKENGSIYGIEINPRFGGGYPLSYQAGANYSGWLLREYFRDEPVGDQFDSWEENLLMLRYDDEIWVHGYTGQ